MSSAVNDNFTIVFLDFGVENESLGRVVILLYKSIVPKSTENFRALCTGEKGIGHLGKPLHYKNSFIHKAIPEFMLQGGDITNFDGSGGESIYGQYFEDENFKLKHDSAGIVSMANVGSPNSNNSQFFITVFPCPHLNGKNVVIGKVIKGYGIIKYICESETENDRPVLKYKIINCGELNPNDDYGINECDGTEDKYPPWPEDWNVKKNEIQLEQFIEVVSHIKNSGNHFYKCKRYFLAARKYRKAIEYCKWYKPGEHEPRLQEIKLNCLLNLSAVELQRKQYKHCLSICNQVLQKDHENIKAIFRKGQANVALNNHELGLECLKRVHRLVPYDRKIIAEIRKVRKSMNDYLISEKEMFGRMFRS